MVRMVIKMCYISKQFKEKEKVRWDNVKILYVQGIKDTYSMDKPPN